MKNHGDHRRRRYARQLIFKLVLLMLPALFWSIVFAALAGARPLESFLDRMPDAAQIAVAVTCPLLAAILGLSTVRQKARRAAHDPEPFGRVTVAASLALIAFALMTTLRPS